ncbi:MAG: helix-turn-helix domain-containing protein [Acetatifactor sp.]|nr:helix-turn-helix domain-containing protein [Acetatifactor sp.]
MDSKKFGEFIATIRKEKGWTQAELANKLSVTDKAVSRWERGLGFPDINTVKPLADALEVSVLEIMQSEKEPEEDISINRATEVLDNMISLVVYQRDIERRKVV